MKEDSKFWGGKKVEVVANKLLYDPSYGLPKDNSEEIDPVYKA